MGKEGISDPNSAAFQELDSNLQKLGMSLAQQLQDSEAAFQISELAGNIQIRRWGLTVIFKLFEVVRAITGLQPMLKFLSSNIKMKLMKKSLSIFKNI